MIYTPSSVLFNDSSNIFSRGSDKHALTCKNNITFRQPFYQCYSNLNYFFFSEGFFSFSTWRWRDCTGGGGECDGCLVLVLVGQELAPGCVEVGRATQHTQSPLYCTLWSPPGRSYCGPLGYLVHGQPVLLGGHVQGWGDVHALMCNKL